MGRAPAFQFYPQDFLVGTANFKPEEVGAYIRLLCYQWEHEKIDSEDVETLTGLPSEKLGRVLKKFIFDPEKSTYKNIRLENVRAQQKSFFEKQAFNGKKGGRPKTQNNPVVISGLTQTITQKNPIEDEVEVEVEVEVVVEDKDEIEEGFKEGVETIKGENVETSGPLEMKTIWLKKKPEYPFENYSDLMALKEIFEFIKTQAVAIKNKADPHFGNSVSDEEVLNVWDQLSETILKDKFWKEKSLSSISKSKQEFWNKSNTNAKRSKSQEFNYDRLKDLLGYKEHGGVNGNSFTG